ncbi:LRP1B, partial [Cordylochernes scorpioides]
MDSPVERSHSSVMAPMTARTFPTKAPSAAHEVCQLGVCVDTNECHIEGICDQLCQLVDNKTSCSCVKGYQMVEDHCKGINGTCVLAEVQRPANQPLSTVPQSAPPTLLFSSSTHIQHVHLNGSLVTPRSSVEMEDSYAVDFNHRNSSACWIALDWISGNWYFLDDTQEIIYLCNQTLEVCLVIVDVALSKPRGIALDPVAGLMFFSEWGNTPPHIQRARLDGSERTRLVEHKIVYPCGLTLDYPSEMVYWVDTYLDNVERVDYNGQNRHTVAHGAPLKILYGISVFEQYFYLTSWHGNSILSIHKYNQSDISSFMLNFTRPFTVHVYHRQRQPLPDQAHPCSINNGLCQHICVPFYKNKVPVAHCLCKAGSKLVGDGNCVAAKQSHFVAYTRGRPGSLKGISLGLPSQEVMVPVVGLNRPTALAFDAATQYLYYSDVQRFVIERQRVDGYGRELFLDKGLNNCEGLAVDWMGRNLYWSDEALLTISVARLDNSTIRRTLISGNMTHPRALVVDPKRGQLYWCQWALEPGSPGSFGCIERAYMDGSHREVFVSKNLHWPNGITIDYAAKKLYWCDAFLHRIERINLSGTGRERKVLYYTEKYVQIILEGEGLGHPYGLAFHEEALYWTEFQQGLVQKLFLHNRSTVTLAVENPPLFEIKIIDNSTQSGMNECTQNNGGCQEFCFATLTNFVCGCRDGFTLAPDGVNCIATANYSEPSRCRKNEFECLKNLRCIDVRYLCDGDNDCGDHSDEDSSPGGICGEYDDSLEMSSCRSDQFKCDVNRCISIHWLCDGERDCADASDEEPIRTCPINSTCDSKQFTCKETGRCIPMSWTCDSDPDCGPGDFSDEHEDCVYHECEANQFMCANRRCISQQYVCDKDDDCRDGSDEVDCATLSPDTLLWCNATSLSCDGGTHCYTLAQKCNGVPDCKDAEDEKNCTNVTRHSEPCHKDFFDCGNGECIPMSAVCNRHPDCLDQRDEASCVNATCSPTEFSCKDGKQCVGHTYICDGEKDCADGSDEDNC